MAVPECCGMQLSVFVAIPSCTVRSIGCDRIWTFGTRIIVFLGEVGKYGKEVWELPWACSFALFSTRATLR